jgi:integrase
MCGTSLIRLGRTKTDQEGRGFHVPVMGRAADALHTWLDAAAITQGPLFRGVAKGGRLAGRLSDRAVARIVQRRAEMAGFDATAFGAHSLRAGFITESGRQRVPLGEAKALSGHRSDAVAMGYYRSGSVIDNPAARLFG